MNLSEKSTAPLTRLNGPMLMRVASGSVTAGVAATTGVAVALGAPLAEAGAALAATAASAAACLLMFCRLMRPSAWMTMRAKKSLNAPLCTLTWVAVAGARATFRPLRLRVFQCSSSLLSEAVFVVGSLPALPVASVVWARKSSSVALPVSCTVGPAAPALNATLPLKLVSARSRVRFSWSAVYGASAWAGRRRASSWPLMCGVCPSSPNHTVPCQPSVPGSVWPAATRMDAVTVAGTPPREAKPLTSSFKALVCSTTGWAGSSSRHANWPSVTLSSGSCHAQVGAGGLADAGCDDGGGLVATGSEPCTTTGAAFSHWSNIN